MRKIFGIICALISLLLFVAAMMVEGPGAGQRMVYNFGYFIGSLFTDKAIMLIEFYGYEEQILELKNQLSSKSGAFSIWLGTLFIAGFTPLPFKLFTITSGIINFNIFVFFIICLFARGLRFFIVAYFSAKFGKAFSLILEKKGAKWFSIIGIVIVIIVSIVYFIFK